MELNQEQMNNIYFPPYRSDYDELKTGFINNTLGNQYDNSLITINKSTSCRFPPQSFQSFKVQFDENIQQSLKTSPIFENQKIEELINKTSEEASNIDTFEIFLFNIGNPVLLSNNKQVSLDVPLLSDKSGPPKTIRVFYNTLVKLLCIYKQYFRTKYKPLPSGKDIIKYNQTRNYLYGNNNKIDDIAGFNISNPSLDKENTGNLLSTDNNLPSFNKSTTSDLIGSNITLSQENINGIAELVMEKFKESMCYNKTSKGGKRLKTRSLRKLKNKTKVRKKQNGKKFYRKKKAKVSKRKLKY